MEGGVKIPHNLCNVGEIQSELLSSISKSHYIFNFIRIHFRIHFDYKCRIFNSYNLDFADSIKSKQSVFLRLSLLKNSNITKFAKKFEGINDILNTGHYCKNGHISNAVSSLTSARARKICVCLYIYFAKISLNGYIDMQVQEGKFSLNFFKPL